jgi:hypothetical protein
MKIEKMVNYEGYYVYFYDTQKMSGFMKPLTSIQPVLKIRSTSEIFKLDKPAYYIDGKPVYC